MLTRSCQRTLVSIILTVGCLFAVNPAFATEQEGPRASTEAQKSSCLYLMLLERERNPDGVRHLYETYRRQLKLEASDLNQKIVQISPEDWPGTAAETSVARLKSIGVDLSRDLVINFGDDGNVIHASFLTRGLRFDGRWLGDNGGPWDPTIGKGLVIVFKDIPKSELDSLVTAIYSTPYVTDIHCYSALVYFIERFSNLRFPRAHPELPMAPTEYLLTFLRNGLIMPGGPPIAMEAYDFSGKSLAQRLSAMSAFEQKTLKWLAQIQPESLPVNDPLATTPYRRFLALEEPIVQRSLLLTSSQVRETYKADVNPSYPQWNIPESLGNIDDGGWATLEIPTLAEDLKLTDTLRLTAASGGAGGIIKIIAEGESSQIVLAEVQVPNTGGWQKAAFIDLPLKNIISFGKLRRNGWQVAEASNLSIEERLLSARQQVRFKFRLPSLKVRIPKGAHRIRLEFSSAPQNRSKSHLMGIWKLELLRYP